MLEAPYSSQHYSNLIWPLWPYPIQSPPKMSLFSGLISSCIFLSFRSCSCKDHLGFPLCYIKRNVCPKHFTGFKNNHQTNELCEFQRLSLGGLPSALRLLSILPLFLLSFLLSLKTNKHLLRSDFEIVPSTLTCLRLCSNISTSQKAFWWILLSLFHYRRKLKKVFSVLLLAGVLLLWRMDKGCLFVGLLRSPFLSYIDARTWVGVGVEWSDLWPSINKQRYPEWVNASAH